jgi:hypothetical protein
MPIAFADDGFPTFQVPGQEAAMRSQGALLRLHYGPRTQTTLWDAWIPRASIWEAIGPPGQESAESMRAYYRASLLNRRIDSEGYVATQQHRGLAHSDGWPFPTWQQARGMGWHFSLDGDVYAQQLGVQRTGSLDCWEQAGMTAGAIEPALGASFRINTDDATLSTPGFSVPPDVWPFVRVEWSANELPTSSRAFLKWATSEQPEFNPDRRIAVAVPGPTAQFENVPLYRHPAGRGTLSRLRLRFEQARGATVVLKSLITAIDTRHPINNSIYLTACCDYFSFTTDVEFLRANLDRMQRVLRFALDEFEVRQKRTVVVPWVGHDGRSGLRRQKNGTATTIPGRGVGNNYWDLLPFGGRDFPATLYLFHALKQLAQLEGFIQAHPEWAIPTDTNRLPEKDLEELAATIRQGVDSWFWDREIGRFIGWVDSAGQAYDFGFTGLNTEAIVYGLATRDQARSILDWLEGRRTIAGDTSLGPDIYHWRFAPRATTRRNTSVYCWVWSSPETIPWGDQVQDGGSVLGFSYFDLIARIGTLGPDNAWARLREIAAWFDEVQAEGGYRAYYAKPGRGTLQGSGRPGGLGLDAEFFESVLVPQVIVDGFLGFAPEPGGFAIAPRLPSDWPSLTVTHIAVQDVVLDIEVSPDHVTIRTRRAPPGGSTPRVRLDGSTAARAIRCERDNTIRLVRGH